MKRLTTDNENSILFPLNLFYAKNKEVWVRCAGEYPDFQDMSLVQWIKSTSQKHGLNFTADDPENLGDEMYDALQDGNDTVEGIVALMHAAAVQATEMRARLEKIEDILGEEYDLEQLRQLVQTTQTGRCKRCRYSRQPSRQTQLYGAPGTLTCRYGPCNRRNVNEHDFCSYFAPKEESEP